MKFREILEDCNIPIAPEGHTHQTEGWIQFDCPFCSRDSGRFRMGYNIRGGFVNCWACGGHSVLSVLREYTELPWAKLKKLMAQVDEVARHPIQRENLRKFTEIPPSVKKLAGAHIRYLSSRGLDYNEIVRLWQVRGIGIASGPLKWRLFIPIVHQGMIISWTTRALGETEFRYLSAKPEQELIPHKNVLYGSDYARQTVVIVEGPIDVWTIGPGAVATFGTAFTPSQINQLLKYPRRMVCYDNETIAQKQAVKLCDALGSFNGETNNIVLDAKDAGEANSHELRQLRKYLK